MTSKAVHGITAGLIPLIYFDMDGVIADFEADLKAFGLHPGLETNRRSELLDPEAQAAKAAVQKEIAFTGFFEDLPPIMPGLWVWRELEKRGHSIGVISATPSFKLLDNHHREGAKAHAAKGKWRWLQTHIGSSIDRRHVHIVDSKDKHLLVDLIRARAGAKLSPILIDDRVDNCESWDRAGGIAFHYGQHAGGAQDQGIHVLSSILSVLAQTAEQAGETAGQVAGRVAGKHDRNKARMPNE